MSDFPGRNRYRVMNEGEVLRGGMEFDADNMGEAAIMALEQLGYEIEEVQPGDGTDDYAWIITKDCLNEMSRGGLKSEAGVFGPRDADPELVDRLKKGEGFKFRMKDDDGEVYYEGLYIERDAPFWAGSPDDGAQPLSDFGSPNAGCTSIEYLQGGNWVVFAD